MAKLIFGDPESIRLPDQAREEARGARYGITNGVTTDWRLKWMAWGCLFERRKEIGNAG